MQQNARINADRKREKEASAMRLGHAQRALLSEVGANQSSSQPEFSLLQMACYSAAVLNRGGQNEMWLI